MNTVNYSKINFVADTWYKVDVLLDWDAKAAALFLDGQFKFSTEFYSKARDEQLLCADPFVNTLMLYTLSPGTSSAFRDLRLCQDLCPDTVLSKAPAAAGSTDPEVLSDPFVVLSRAFSSLLHPSSMLAATLALSFALI